MSYLQQRLDKSRTDLNYYQYLLANSLNAVIQSISKVSKDILDVIEQCMKPENGYQNVLEPYYKNYQIKYPADKDIHFKQRIQIITQKALNEQATKQQQKLTKNSFVPTLGSLPEASAFRVMQTHTAAQSRIPSPQVPRHPWGRSVSSSSVSPSPNSPRMASREGSQAAPDSPLRRQRSISASQSDVYVRDKSLEEIESEIKNLKEVEKLSLTEFFSKTMLMNDLNYLELTYHFIKLECNRTDQGRMAKALITAFGSDLRENTDMFDDIYELQEVASKLQSKLKVINQSATPMAMQLAEKVKEFLEVFSIDKLVERWDQFNIFTDCYSAINNCLSNANKFEASKDIELFFLYISSPGFLESVDQIQFQIPRLIEVLESRASNLAQSIEASSESYVATKVVLDKSIHLLRTSIRALNNLLWYDAYQPPISIATFFDKIKQFSQDQVAISLSPDEIKWLTSIMMSAATRIIFPLSPAS